MRILYLAEDYIGTMVHHNLCNQLVHCKDSLNDVVLYCYNRKSNAHLDKRDKYGAIDYSAIVNDFKGSEFRYRFDFLYKKKKKLADLLSMVDPSSINVTHAATLFSEGIIAYELNKRYGIPYTVGVRGTDVSLYLKYMFHLWPIGRKILQNASKVIFIAEHIRLKVLSSRMVDSIADDIRVKSVIEHNGIDEYWIEHWCEKKPIEQASKIIYIGRFDSNKNVERLMDAVKMINDDGRNVHLTLIGGGAERHDAVVARCESQPELYSFVGPIYDKDKLSKALRESDVFAMVSHKETFGLVYIEAMSQGLPVLFSKGQGIDGIFTIKTGEAVDSYNVLDIKRGLSALIENYQTYVGIGDKIKEFSWKQVAERYIDIFDLIAKK